jgi:hypothetical protein
MYASFMVGFGHKGSDLEVDIAFMMIFVECIINVKMMNLEELNYFYLMVVNS